MEQQRLGREQHEALKMKKERVKTQPTENGTLAPGQEDPMQMSPEKL